MKNKHVFIIKIHHRARSKIICIIIFSIITLSLASCVLIYPSFTSQERKIVNPFEDAKTVVYKSLNGDLTDTIHFYKYEIDTFKIRHLERGYYNEIVLRVRYEIAKGSYHKRLLQPDNKQPDDFILFSKSSGSNSLKQIEFLELVFNEDYIDNILSSQDSIFVFGLENTCYRGGNINEGIKSFVFDLHRGVLSFVDKKGVEWIANSASQISQ